MPFDVPFYNPFYNISESLFIKNTNLKIKKLQYVDVVYSSLLQYLFLH